MDKIFESNQLKCVKDVRQKHKNKLAKALQALSGAVQNFSNLEVCDEIACDFFANRLPPFGYEGETIGK